MHGLFVLAPVLLLAGFSPPNSLPGALPPQGVQEGPPRSWIPEKAPKPPIIVAPDTLIPEKAPPASCTQPFPQPVSEAFVNAYNEAKHAVSIKDYEQALALALKAESLTDRPNAQAAAISIEMLALVSLKDAAGAEAALEKRVALGCLSAIEQRNLDYTREAIEKLKAGN